MVLTDRDLPDHPLLSLLKDLHQDLKCGHSQFPAQMMNVLKLRGLEMIHSLRRMLANIVCLHRTKKHFPGHLIPLHILLSITLVV